MTFRVIQSNSYFDSSLVFSLGSFKQFLRKLPPSAQLAKFDLSDLSKWPLGRFNQIHIYTVHWYLPKEAPRQKKRQKVIWPF